MRTLRQSGTSLARHSVPIRASRSAPREYLLLCTKFASISQQMRGLINLTVLCCLTVLQDESEVEEALDRGLEAVQLLHTDYSRLLTQLRNAREVRSDRTKVAFSVGTVFTHKKFGYRGKLLTNCSPVLLP